MTCYLGNTTAQGHLHSSSFVSMVTIYKQLYLNVKSPPRTKTIVGICTSAHENMTAVAIDNSEHNHHKAPFDMSTFYIRGWRILSSVSHRLSADVYYGLVYKQGEQKSAYRSR